jgi:xylulokinase
MIMNYLLGLDAGTTSTRTILIDENGRVVAVCSRKYPMVVPRHGWAEQEAEDWYRAAILTVREVLEKSGIDAREIIGIGLSGQMHGAVVLDKSGKPIRPVMIWCDNRAYRQTEKIYDIFGYHNFIKLSYNQALPGYIAPKLLWIKDNEPENYKKINRFLFPKDYIRYRFSGVFATEVSDASGSVMMDIPNRCWSDEIVSGLDIDKKILPDIFESVDIISKVNSETAQTTGLVEGTPIAGGGGDNAAGAIGTGIIREGVISDSLGTSGVLFIHTDSPVFDPEGRFHCTCHTVPYKWNLLGATLSAAGSLKWYGDRFGMDKNYSKKYPDVTDVYELLNRQVEEIKPASDGLLFLPYLIGERTPYSDAHARGVFFGISYLHTSSHFVRSIMEGVAFSQRDCLEIAKELGAKHDKVILTGGGSRSKVWRQIMADILNSNIAINNVNEGPAFGAALIAGVGTGLYSDVEDAHNRTVEETDSIVPIEKNVVLYDRLYDIYRNLYNDLKHDFKKITELQK